MKKTIKNSAIYVLVAVFLVGVLLTATPKNVNAQSYYYGSNYGSGYINGYMSSYNGYGYGSGLAHHVMVRRPSSISNYSYNYNSYIPPVYYPYNYNYGYQYVSPVSVSCSLSNGSDANGTYIAWTAYAYGGSGGYSYTWSGTDNPTSLNSSTINVYYQTPGSKSMNVTVWSANGQTATAYCGSSYFNLPYYNNYYGSYQGQYQYQYQPTPVNYY